MLAASSLPGPPPSSGLSNLSGRTMNKSNRARSSAVKTQRRACQRGTQKTECVLPLTIFVKIREKLQPVYSLCIGVVSGSYKTLVIPKYVGRARARITKALPHPRLVRIPMPIFASAPQPDNILQPVSRCARYLLA
jgi:hypothetical protein